MGSKRSRKTTVGGSRALRAGATLPKAASGIRGLDEITSGGLPRGRPTLICGGAGCGKTLMAMEFLVRGVTEYGEPGVFMAFEETAEELTANVASLGFDLEQLIAHRKLMVDYVHIDRSEIEETGTYDLEGLFVRLKDAIDTVKAKRVVLDTVETLFAGLPNPLILRAELRRLFRWLKDIGITAIVTGEKGEGTLTRESLEEYVSDCVIVLDHRVNEQSATRRLRIAKYRGSTHGTNEYPFLIDSNGISILPITSLGLAHKAQMQRISSGIESLDRMLGGKGYYRGSTVLVSGTAGTGKTSIASLLMQAACRRGERCLMFAFEESTEQLVRNMNSVGIRLQPLINKGLLRIVASRPSAFGIEMHLVGMHKTVLEFEPELVVIDPITNLTSIASGLETQSMLTRIIDFLKTRGTTALLTSLTASGNNPEQTEVGISSLVDTWILLETLCGDQRRQSTLTIVKSRGMAHSREAAEYRLTDTGIDLLVAGAGGTNTNRYVGKKRYERED